MPLLGSKCLVIAMAHIVGNSLVKPLLCAMASLPSHGM
jgi:hypothetical protein